MFGWLSAVGSMLFGGSKARADGHTFAQEAAAGIGRYIDEQQLTGQEAAELNLKAGAMIADMAKATANENGVRAVTRRVLAWSITAFVLIWSSVGMVLAIRGDMTTVDNMIKVVEAFRIGLAFAGVCGFYFLANVMRGIKT